MAVQAVPSGEVTLAGPGLTLVGTVQPERSGTYADTPGVRIIGGAGKLTSNVAPKSHRGETVRGILADLLGGLGEQLGAVDATVGSRRPSNWVRFAGRADTELSAILAGTGAVWRVADDGTVAIVVDTWSPSSLDYVLIDDDVKAAVATIATDVASLRPGVTLDGRRVQSVTLMVSADKVRTSFAYEASEGAQLGQIIAATVQPALLTRTPYLCTVLAQDSEGTLTVQPDDPKLPAIDGVPLFSLPGVRATIRQGARVILELAGGSRGSPYVALAQADDSVLDHLSIAGGTLPVARKTDPVDLGYLVGSTPSGGGIVTFSLSSVPAPNSIHLTGTITDGVLTLRA